MLFILRLLTLFYRKLPRKKNENQISDKTNVDVKGRGGGGGHDRDLVP